MAASDPCRATNKNPFWRNLLKPTAPTEPQKRIFRGGGRSDLKGKDGNGNGIGIGGKCDPRTIVRMLVASEIVGATYSPKSLSGWIRDLAIGSRYNATLEEIPRAPKASKIVAGDAYRWTTPHTHTSQCFTLLLTASTAIETPQSGEKIIRKVSEQEKKYFVKTTQSIAFTLFDTNRDGFLNSDDVQTFMHVYGLEETTYGSDLLNIAHGRVTKEQFESWLHSNKTDLLSVRYPFKLLRLVSYCFRHDSFLCPSEMSYFMNAIFEQTFGKKAKLEGGMFGHYGNLNYVRDIDKSRRLLVEDIEILAQLWGLTPEASHAVVAELKVSGDAGNVYPYRLFLKLRENFNTQGPKEVSDLFPLLDRNKDGFLSPAEIAYFAARFNQELSEDQIDLVINTFDLDKDSYIGLQDFHQAMLPVLRGTSWEVWLVGVAWAFLLAANPTRLLDLDVVNASFGSVSDKVMLWSIRFGSISVPILRPSG